MCNGKQKSCINSKQIMAEILMRENYKSENPDPYLSSYDTLNQILLLQIDSSIMI